ncbi:Auxin response factor 18 [Apostasia shenzhenica]|uniref:Auxin response factor n=1 Tax=Apostasia shenzhenica TaxID=1088818 RepID=A0A2I0BBA0_9ASPA|nr:Auxin response factor 18 [Apostasia shenzhenica]
MQQENDKCVNSRLWHACAGELVEIPPANSIVYYIPQGHAEHAQTPVNLNTPSPSIPPLLLCLVTSVEYKAEPQTDDIFARISLLPLTGKEASQEKPAFKKKNLTQSDANNGGGFSVPKDCAESLFPPLDYSSRPPIQILTATDVHGMPWTFRHIYRGTPQRHLLTTGWSTFLNKKKLVTGDLIIFLRNENGDLCVGFRRAREGVRLSGRVSAESVMEAATLAVNGKPFEVTYYPAAGTPEFVVRASKVRAAMAINWRPDMRIKMALELEDFSKTSWFNGVVSSVQVSYPERWPKSPWRLLQVSWDEGSGVPEELKSVNPWQVEPASNLPPIHISPMPLPGKNIHIPPQHPGLQSPDSPSYYAIVNPQFISSRRSSLWYLPTASAVAGIQGARHDNNQPATNYQAAHCKVFMESEDVGRVIDLSSIVSPEDLYHRLSNMFGVHTSDLINTIDYRDATAVEVKHASNEPFFNFLKKVKRLTILKDPRGNSRES